MKKRYRTGLMAADVFPDHWSADPFVFETTRLPHARFMPEIGNGNIATVVHGPWIHMNGLYNGQGSQSSRARIPSLVGFQICLGDGIPARETYSLNLREGIFTEAKYYHHSSIIVQRQIFVHRLHANLVLFRLSFDASSAKGPTTVVLDGWPDETQLKSDDFDFKATSRPKGHKFRLASGATYAPEVEGDERLPVFLAWHSTKELATRLMIDPKDETIDFFMAVGPDETSVTRIVTYAIDQGFEALRKSHVEKWSDYWNNGKIEVDPEENFELAQALLAAFYYLLTSLPNLEEGVGKFVGLSPGGLSRGAPGDAIDQDYLGHIFWDTEIWMFPPVLFFHPDQARLLVESRTRVLEAAINNARVGGFDGAKFPWESALSGTETTPWPPAGVYEIHITADIAFAVRQLLYATADKVKLIEELRLEELTDQIAAFWSSRLSWIPSAKKNTEESCHINGVMGPDEYHYPVNDSVFTNYVAKLAMTLPKYIATITKKWHPNANMWADAAAMIPVLSEMYDDKPFHPEFDGFLGGELHPASSRKRPLVKQADVILLGFPLDMDMSLDLRKNDLEIYERITDPKGPAMTWGMFAIGMLEVGSKLRADEFFSKYKENVQPPFNVWSEEIDGGGAVNFLTGMGGFLQSVLNGYGGFRVRETELAFDPVDLPGTSKWSITGMKYLDHTFDFKFDFLGNSITILVRRKSHDLHLVVETASGAKYLLTKDLALSYRKEKSKIIRHYPALDVISTSTNA